jgi:hypothetical protein
VLRILWPGLMARDPVDKKEGVEATNPDTAAALLVAAGDNPERCLKRYIARETYRAILLAAAVPPS